MRIKKKRDYVFIGCKSNNISIQDKLAQVNKIIDDLENDIYPESKTQFILKLK